MTDAPEGQHGDDRYPGGPDRTKRLDGESGSIAGQQPVYGQPQYGQPQQQYNNPGFPGFAGSYKPGVIPLRPLGVGEILDGAFTTIRKNPAATLGMSFAINAVVSVVTLIAQILLKDSGDVARVVLAIVSSLLGYVANLVLAGALVVVVSEAVLGRRIAIGAALARLKGRIGGLVGLSLLVGLCVLVGLIGLFIGAIYVYVILALAAPAFVLERAPVTTAMRRSRELVRGSWWRIFGILLLGGLIASIVAGILSVPFTLGAASSSGIFSGGTSGQASLGTGSLILVAVGNLLARTISAPISAGIIALLYIDQRMRREGLDLTLAQAARENENARWDGGGTGQQGQYQQGQYQQQNGQFQQGQYQQGQYPQQNGQYPGGNSFPS
jgi:hypothetical protein